MSDYCNNKDHKNDPDWSYTKDGCPFCRLEELEQQKRCVEEQNTALAESNARLTNQNAELEQELEQYRSIAENMGATIAVSELKQQIVFKQEQCDELAHEILACEAANINAGIQNAKLAAVLDEIARFGSSDGCQCFRIARKALEDKL